MDASPGTTPKTFAERLNERIPKIESYLRLLVVPGNVFEVRALDVGSYNQTFAGFFDDPHKAAEAIARIDTEQPPRGIYLTLNPVQAELLCRINNRLAKVKRGELAADKHVIRRLWLFVDIDPERAGGVSGIPANEAERQVARQRADDVRDWLMNHFGWHEPIEVDSGNGHYLLFAIDLPNNDESTLLVKAVLAGIASKWSDASVKIDATVCNPARIARVFCTVNRKGDSTEERPHRFANHLHVPDYLRDGWAEPLPVEKLQAVAALAPKEEKKPPKSKKSKTSQPAASADGTGDFNHRLMVEVWLAEFGVDYRQSHRLADGRECWQIPCPFNPDHGYDAAVMQAPDGKTGFHCHHDSCAGFGWQDAKEKIGKPAGDHYDPPLNIIDDDDRWTSIFTDEGRTPAAFARRFLKAYGDDVLYVPAWDCWLWWDGTRWVIDTGNCAIIRLSQAVSDAIWHEVATCHSDDAISYAQDMSNPAKWKSSLKAAAAMRVVEISELNRNLLLLNCPNGTVDLKSGELKKHDKADRITKLCATEFDPSAKCPTWEKFVSDIFAESGALIAYSQRLCGWWLTGVIQEHLLHIAYGIGANGKSTFFNTQLDMLGRDYSMQAPPDLLVEKKGESHPTERADLHGMRLVVASETEGGAKLAESLTKQLTGGDKIRARRMRENFWEFDPTHKLVLLTNHKPRVRGQDLGIWRRLRMLPFNEVFDGDRADKSLPAKLRDEAPGILAWCVRGCLAWQAEGLLPPPEVQAATSAYKTSQDVFGRFTLECCVVGSDHFESKFSELRDALETWCKETGENAPGPKTFAQWLQDQGYKPFRSGGMKYRGIGLKA